jgi:hypothetical protein
MRPAAEAAEADAAKRARLAEVVAAVDGKDLRMLPMRRSMELMGQMNTAKAELATVPPLTREQREQAADAKERLELVLHARLGLRTKREATESSLKHVKEWSLSNAVASVVKADAALASLLARFDAVQAEAEEVLSGKGALPAGREHFDVVNPDFPANVDNLAERMGAWLAALETDPDAVFE